MGRQPLQQFDRTGDGRCGGGGLDLELLKRTPAGLPQREDYFYFKIEKEGPYWANVVRDRNVALSDALDPKLKFSLYIITKPGS